MVGIKLNFAGNTYLDLDNGGRRIGIDRRCYSYSGHIPERRSGNDRRNIKDRRFPDTQVSSLNHEQREVERRRAIN
jgi:hypothetical protein